MHGQRIFFFSSRRRHTSWTGDWSSDVCSSDLIEDAQHRAVSELFIEACAGGDINALMERSEERRVGKECRYGWLAIRNKKQQEIGNDGSPDLRCLAGENSLGHGHVSMWFLVAN